MTQLWCTLALRPSPRRNVQQRAQFHRCQDALPEIVEIVEKFEIDEKCEN